MSKYLIQYHLEVIDLAPYEEAVYLEYFLRWYALIAREPTIARKRTATSVTVNQVSKVELTKRGSQISLEI